MVQDRPAGRHMVCLGTKDPVWLGGRVGTSCRGLETTRWPIHGQQRDLPFALPLVLSIFQARGLKAGSHMSLISRKRCLLRHSPLLTSPLRSVRVLRTDQSSRWKPDGRLVHRVLEIMPSKTCLLFSAVPHTPGDTSGRHAAVFVNRSGGFAYAPVTNSTWSREGQGPPRQPTDQTGQAPSGLSSTPRLPCVSSPKNKRLIIREKIELILGTVRTKKQLKRML